MSGNYFTRRPGEEMVRISLPEQIGFEFTFPTPKPTLLLSIDELYDNMSESMAVDALEDHRVERKASMISAKNLAEYFSMWANTSPDGGIILVGIEDDGKIAGCSSTGVKHANELQRAGDVYCADARYQCKTVPVVNVSGNQDTMLAIRVLYKRKKLSRLVPTKPS